ncbi:hypothetical protein [Moritella sp. Urea-trap-13]|uniref:hypothetical protein n=1 Tax=Moritella sp. Urea-trap-13 TaxID=2058327 RepID=UPI000C32E965|nr:hypothetical protein [Moritella sp. Urea-trap-13]PKH05245.1 hypothetical protein CXF93_18300 [Moritella sp. Urea-trap-13]
MIKLLPLKNKENLFILTSLLIYAIMLVMKDIDIFITPRFWAEEASVYYKDAFINGFSSIFSTHQGYYSIVPNISTYISTLFPMKIAPVITTYIAFIIQLIPAFLILKTSCFDDNKKYKALLLLSLLLAGFTNEIFSNTITSQFHFIIVAYIILIGDFNTKLSAPLLFISALSGPAACFILPFFILKTILNRTNSNVINTLVFLFATIIQLCFVVTAEHYGSRTGANLLTLQFIDKIVNLSFFSLWGGGALLLKSITLFIIFYSILQLGRDKKNEIIFYYLTPLVFITLLLTVTSLNGAGGGRYAYATGFVFCALLLKVLFENSNDVIISYSLIFILLFSLAQSGYSTYQSKDGVVSSSSWISWESQIEDYKSGKIDTILIYPQSKHAMWQVKL